MFETSRQQTKLIIDGLLHRCNLAGVPYYIVNTGGHDGCAILCKVYVAGQGACLYGQMRDMEGELKWYQVFDDTPKMESEVDQYIQNEISFDADLWVVEFELTSFLNPFDNDDFLNMA